MNTTAESTFSLQAAIEWSVPSRWQPELSAILTDYQRLKALAPDLAAAATVPTPDTAKVARAAHAREAKAERKHAVLTAGVERYRLQLASWTGTDTARAKWLVKLLGPDAPHWRYVYDHLKTMQF